MTKYAILILVTSMLLSCENASSLLKKECNITTAQQSVWALPEVQAKIEQSKALSGKERIQYTQDTIVVLKNTYYRIKLRYNLSYTQLPIATYLVAKNNCNEIFINTPAKELIPYTTYQQQQAQQTQQQKNFPTFFKQFTANMLFRQQHLADQLTTLTTTPDGSLILQEEQELITKNINELQNYTFTYYPDSVCCKNTEEGFTLLFAPHNDTWLLTQIWQ